MTVFESVFSAWRLPLLGFLFLLLTAQMALAIAAFREGRSRRAKGCLLAPFLLCAAFFWLCLSLIGWDANYSGGPESLPAWLAAFGSLPAWSALLLEIAAAVALAFCLRDTLRFRGNHLTPDSVKQAMDLLPVGVAFAAPDGNVLFRNLVMDRLSSLLTGKLLTDLGGFRAAAGEGTVALEGRVWQIGFREDAGAPLVQAVATDITEQAEILADLEEKNRKLRDLNLRLKVYSRQAERIVIAQEMLSARMTVHSEVGNALLESRHYLRDPASFDEEKLLQSLRRLNAWLLRDYEEDDTARDALSDAVDMAEALGVEVEIAGVVPPAGPFRSVLAAAVRECASNAVKHADGNRLSIDVQSADGAAACTLHSNGRAPAGPVRESGGLANLRALVEKEGGEMRISSDPGFTLRIRLPAKPDPDEKRTKK